MRAVLIASLFVASSASAVTLTADLRSNKDSATCDWNTALGKISTTKSSNAAALDFGTGADGDCRFSGTLDAREYNCRTLSVTGAVRFTGTTPVVIRVQGHAEVRGQLRVDGFAGNDGTQTSPDDVTTLGGVPGPGGYAGGNFETPGGFPTSSPGAQRATGAGDVGFFGTSLDVGLANIGGGGGGGGGSFGDSTAGEVGEDGTIAGNAIAGTGGATSAPDTTANESAFENSLLFIGGAGGGAGGPGSADGGALQFYPAAGGGGGGALRLVVGGDIIITGLVSADGGKGGDALELGGAGGGGAGGALWLQAAGQIRNSGTIRALGGAGGEVRSTLAARGGRGGDGGVGRIRFDDADGIIEGNSATPMAQLGPGTPGAFDVSAAVETCTAQSLAFDTAGLRNSFRSLRPLEELNGGTIALQLEESDDGVAWSAPAPLTQLSSLSKRYLRFQLSLTNVDAQTPTVLEGFALEYDIQEKSDLNFTSDVSCGTIDVDGSPGSGPGMMWLTVGLGMLLAGFGSRKKTRS